MRDFRAKIGPLLAFVLLVHLGAAMAVKAQPVSFDGILRHQKQGGDVDDQSTTEQTYNIALQKALSAAAIFSGDLRYSETERTNGGELTLLTPSGSLDLRNDLFVFNLNGSVTQIDSESSPDVESRSWNANWFSIVPDWPRLRLTYGQTITDRGDGAEAFQTDITTYGANLLYDRSLFRFLYDFRRDEVDDEGRRTETDSERHLGQIIYTQSLLQGRLLLNASEQVSYTRFTDVFNGAAGEVQFRPVTLLGGLAASDDTPAFGALDPASALIDGDFGTGVVEVLQSTIPQNLGLETGFEQVERIRLVFDRLIDTTTRNQLTWEVYASDDNLNWSPVGPIAIAFEEELVLSALVTVVDIDLPRASASQFIKIVVENPAAPILQESAFITEVLAGTLVEGTGEGQGTETENLNLKSTVGVSYRLTPKWVVGYRLDHLWQDDANDRESWSMTNSLNSNYLLNPFLSFALGATENRDKRENLSERISRSYSGSVNARPLPTIDMSLGYTHIDSYEDGDLNQKADTVYGNLVAWIFPDLSSNLTGTWSASENVETGTDSLNYFLSLDVTARISPRLNLDLDTVYEHSEIESTEGLATSDDRVRYGARVSYRPSDLLLLQGDVDRDEAQDSTALFGSVFWRITPKIQNNVTTILRFEEDANLQSYQYRINWVLSPHIFVDTNIAFTDAEEIDSWELFSSLNVSL